MKTLTEALIRQLKALYGRDYPRKGICHHLGVHFKCGRDRIGLCSRGTGKDLLVTVYADHHATSYSQSRHQKVRRAVVKAVQKLRRKAKFEESWNGLDGHNGISIVISNAVPQSLKTATTNYRKMPDVFKPTDEESRQFEAFSLWRKTRLHRGRSNA